MPRFRHYTTPSIVLALVACTSLGCGDVEYEFETAETSTSSIINGSVNRTNNDVISIWRADTDKHWCTGTRVSYNAIITAMHCACDYLEETRSSDPNLTKWRFREGTDVILEENTDLAYNGTTLTVDDFEIRADCASSKSDGYTDVDLMLIKTDPPIGLLNGYGRYEMRTLYNFGALRNPIGTEVRIVGYGRSEAKVSGLSAGQRLEGTMRVDDMYEDTPSINRSFAFEPLKPVGEGGATTCAGDSGAPVFYGDNNGESAIYGIYSAGDESCGSSSATAGWGRATIIDDDHRDWYWQIANTEWLFGADPLREETR